MTTSLFDKVYKSMTEDEMGKHLAYSIAGSITHKDGNTIVYMGSAAYKRIADYEMEMVKKYIKPQQILEVQQSLQKELKDVIIIRGRNAGKDAFAAFLNEPGPSLQEAVDACNNLSVLKGRIHEYMVAPPTKITSDINHWFQEQRLTNQLGDIVTLKRDFNFDALCLQEHKEEEDADLKLQRKREKRGEIFSRPKGESGGFRKNNSNQTKKKKRRK